MKNEDRFRAFNVGIEKQDKTLDLLKNLEPRERGDAIRGYRKAFGEDLKESLLKNVDTGNKPFVDLLANENALTGDQALITARKHVTDSTTGWLARQSLKSDSAPLNKLSELTTSHRENEGSLSPAEVERRTKEISEKLKSFEGTKEELANMITESVITTGSLVAAPFTGGTSLGLLNFTAKLGTASLGGD